MARRHRRIRRLRVERIRGVSQVRVPLCQESVHERMKLTILMYHKIDEPHPSVRYPGNYVRPPQFEQQMDALLMWGYRSIRFDTWLDYRDGRIGSLPDKPVIVTFDDGYTCFDRNAWPVLRARGMGATAFLVAGQI